jgi:predicted branched-subunit amino acid permease
MGYLIGDIGFVKFMERLQRDPLFPHKDWTMLGASAANWLTWQTGSLIGIFAAAFIPTHWGLELAGTLALLALLIPQCLGHRAWKPTLTGACVAGCVSVLAHALPMKLGLLLGVLCGIAAALLVEPRGPAVHASMQEAR